MQNLNELLGIVDDDTNAGDEPGEDEETGDERADDGDCNAPERCRENGRGTAAPIPRREFELLAWGQDRAHIQVFHGYVFCGAFGASCDRD